MQWTIVSRLHNAAFVDEATYIVAGRLQHAADRAGALPNFSAYFSGAPALYPPLAAWADRLGGLDGARLLNLVLVWVATLAVYAVGRRVFRDRVAGVLGAAVFAVQAPVLFIARIATVDAPSVAALGLALAVALGGRTERERALFASLGGALAGLAVGFKYAALLYLPSLVVVVALAPGGRSKAVCSRGLLVLVGTLVACGAVVAFGGRELIDGFISTTATRLAPSGGSVVDILRFAATLGGAAALVALPALLLSSPVSVVTRVVLFATAFLAPMYHARLHEFTSLHKHVAFGALFLAPLAGGSLGAGVKWMVAQWRRGHGMFASGVAAAVALLSYRSVLRPSVVWAERLYAYAPQPAGVARLAVRSFVTRDSHILDEEPDLGAFYLPETAYAQWSHPYDFVYHASDGRSLRGREGHLEAVRAGYFDVVLLRYGPQRAWARAVEAELLASQPRYRLARRFPFTLDDGAGHFELWVRSDSARTRDEHRR